MKLKLFIFSIFVSLSITNAHAANNVGVRTINQTGKLKCGTDISAKTLAYRDKDGFWHGYAVDWCKIFAKAMLNRTDAFEMVDINEHNMERAFAEDKIDVAIGFGVQNVAKEYNSRAVAAAIIAYDYQTLIIRKKDEANSLESFRGEKICAMMDSSELVNMQNYIDRYDLGISILPMRDQRQIREAFLLKRCSMVTGERSRLISFHKNFLEDKDIFKVIPENIAVKPLFVYVKHENNKLRTLTSLVVNSMLLADKYDINSKNLDIIFGINDTSLRNLLGDNDKLWSSLGLVNPQWVKEVIKEFGSFSEIYKRNFGEETIFNFENDKNNILDKGGLFIPRLFI